MALDLGALVQGLSTAVGGVAEGLNKRRTLERQALQQALAQRLQDAQIQNYQSEIQRRADQTRIDEQKARNAKAPPRLVDPVTGAIWERDPETGEWKQGVMAAPTPPTPKLGQSDAPGHWEHQQDKDGGYWRWRSDPGQTAQQPSQQHAQQPARLHVKPKQQIAYDAQGNAINVTTTPSGGISTQAVPGVAKPLTPQERVAGSQAGTVDDAVTRLERIARYHPKAFGAAVGFIRAQHHGVVGRLASEARGVLSDRDAVDAVQAYQTYLLGISPTYGGVRPTKTLLELETDASLPPWLADTSTWTNSLKTMRARISDIRAKAGRAAPPSDAPPEWLR